jgi:hypothetical protein
MTSLTKLILCMFIAISIGSCIYGVRKAKAQEEYKGHLRIEIRDHIRAHGTDADNYLYDACDRAYPTTNEDVAFLKCLEVLKVWDGNA